MFKFIENKTYILDGGMGQILLEKGLKPKGTLWSASALIDKNCNDLVVESHIDFINAGSELIVTNNFAVRKRRLLQNNSIEYFEFANKRAGQLAEKAKNLSGKPIIIAGSLPTRGDTYLPTFFHSDKDIYEEFYITAKILNPYVDIFFLDVMSSIKEITIACDAIKEFIKPILIGLHLNKNCLLPSRETISEVIESINNYNCCGIIGACISPEIMESALPEFKNQKLPYGFKVNAFKNIPKNFVIDNKSSLQPNKILGVREDFTSVFFEQFVEKLKNQGATLLGGCCEVKPEHIKTIKNVI